MDESPKPVSADSPMASPALATSLAEGAKPTVATTVPSDAGDSVESAAQHVQVERMLEREAKRLQVAWGKLTWLLCFLAILLGISYTLPRIVESLHYAAARGEQRARYELAKQELADSPLSQLSAESQKVAECVGPSVVHIHTVSHEPDISPSGLTWRGIGKGRMPSDGQGSGFIIDSSGILVTNHHVVVDAKEIHVALSDGRKLDAKMIGFDRNTDLAVLRVHAEGLIAAEWGDSDKLDIGSMVWAMGSPFGLTQSITSGIVSGKHRAGMAGNVYQDFLQTDAAVNPGNSGGPLVDTRGRIIGVNSAIVGEAYQGISFAIPSNLAKDVVASICREGRMRRGWLGIRMDVVSEERAKSVGQKTPHGVWVVRVVSEPLDNAPAFKAGIREGDIVTHWNGEEVKDPNHLSTLVARTPIGSDASVKVFRNGQEIQMQITVGERAEGE